MCDLTGWTVEWSGDVLVGTHQDGRRMSLGEVAGSRWWLYDPTSDRTGGLRRVSGYHETQPHVAVERLVIARGGHVGPACLPGPDLRRWRLAQGLSTRALASQLQQWLPARTVASIAATLSQVEREEYPAPGYLRAALRARIDQPSEPARAPESSTPEEAPARASVVAAQPGSGELGGVASPGAGAPQAADRTREPELGGASPPPAADPCSPLSRPSGDSSTAAPAADRADLRADREGGGSGAYWGTVRIAVMPAATEPFEYSMSSDAARPRRPGLDLPASVNHLADGVHTTKEWSPYPAAAKIEAEVERLREADRQRDADRPAATPAEDRVQREAEAEFGIEVSEEAEIEVDWPRLVRDAYQRVAEIEAEVVRLQVRLDAELRRVRADAAVQHPCADAGSLAADLQLVRESLDRLGVPEGELGWRLGWLEGRQGGGR